MRTATWGPPRSTRLPRPIDRQLREAADRRGVTISELLRTAWYEYTCTPRHNTTADDTPRQDTA